MHSKKQRSGLEYACMEMTRHKYKVSDLKTAFLRKPYQYTKAETKDEKQAKMHEFDWLK